MNPRKLLAEGESGSAFSSQGPQGYRCSTYHAVKFPNNIVRVYVPRYYYSHNRATRPIAIFRQNSITICDEFGILPLFRLGWLPIHGYRVMRGVGIMHVFGRGSVPSFDGARFDYNGNLLSNVPRDIQKKYVLAQTEDREIRNRNARARYHDKKAIARLRKATEGTHDLLGIDDRYGLDDIPLNDVFKLRNSASRNILLNHFGVEKILSSLDSTELDKDMIDGRSYRLVSFEMPDYGSGTSLATYLEMENPSTGEKHLEGVPNYGEGWNAIPENTVIAALAWRDGESDYIKPVVLR
jgi:hypothetical protein